MADDLYQEFAEKCQLASCTDDLCVCPFEEQWVSADDYFSLPRTSAPAENMEITELQQPDASAPAENMEITELQQPEASAPAESMEIMQSPPPMEIARPTSSGAKRKRGRGNQPRRPGKRSPEVFSPSAPKKPRSVPEL